MPFTTGILIGLGETRRDRVEALLAIRGLHRQYGHIQVQRWVGRRAGGGGLSACMEDRQRLCFQRRASDPGYLLGLPNIPTWLATRIVCENNHHDTQGQGCKHAFHGLPKLNINPHVICLQEVIIQNFRAKKGTAMAAAPEPSLNELLWTVAVARLLFGPEMSIQAPPNLTPAADDAHAQPSPAHGWRLLLAAGANDFGGVSPITRDFVNPEKPWPHLTSLAAATAAAGKLLVPRLPVYPPYLKARGQCCV